jgi:hypothetical protein
MKMRILSTAVPLFALAIGSMLAHAAEVARPRPGAPGQWVQIGRVSASHQADHDRIVVQGRFDDFRRLKFSVKDAPLKLRRVVVTYDRGGAEKLEVRDDIRKGGETRAIDLNGGQRSLRSIEFWYETKGWLNGKADVTAWGLR